MFFNVYSKEKTSQANSARTNTKLKISAVDEIQRKAIGRCMDAINIGGFKELECMEAGPVLDQTKEFKNACINIPMVMKDMSHEIIEGSRPLVRHVHLMGCMIIGINRRQKQGFLSKFRTFFFFRKGL